MLKRSAIRCIFYASMWVFSMQHWKHILCRNITMRGTHATEVYMKVHILCNGRASNMYSGASDLPFGGLGNTTLLEKGTPWLYWRAMTSAAALIAILTWSRLKLGVEAHLFFEAQTRPEEVHPEYNHGICWRWNTLRCFDFPSFLLLRSLEPI